jgi:hypothetical protein
LRYNKRADAFLQYGWIVERHLKDGEYVILNLFVDHRSDAPRPVSYCSIDSPVFTR